MRVQASCVAVLCLAMSGAARSAPERLVAVLEARNQAVAPIGDRLAYAQGLREALARRLTNAHVMTSEEMLVMARENPSALDRCIDEDCVSVGRLLGADVVVELRITDASRGALILIIRAVNVETARVIGTTRVIRQTPAELLAELDHAAEGLARRIARPPRPPVLRPVVAR